VEVNGVYSESNVFLGYRDLAQNEIYRVTNNEWNWQVFNGLEMTITQQTGRLQFIASYGRQWQSMEGTWQPRDPAAILQPNAFANTGGLGNTAAPVSAPTDANSLSGTQSTGGTPWQDHVLRGGVSFQAPLGLLLSTTFQYQSGQWSGPIITRVTAETRYGPATVTLPNGRVVSNPLATPNRFVGETRTDQQFTLPAYHTVSLRVGRRFSIGRLNIDGGVEAFNLFNEDADVDMRSGGNQTFNPNYRLTQTPQRARSGQLAFRVTF
jgi:hypothetical protein